MLDNTKHIITDISNKTNKVMLFHSMSGKDSIALLHLLYPHVEVTCVFMYVVRDLDHINRYVKYINKNYPKAKVIQIPHYAVFSYIKSGYLGCKQNIKQRQYNLSQLTDILKERLGIEWACFGFKKSDSMNRRLMLRTYDKEAINHTNKKFYPLSDYKNKDILKFIEYEKLITPESYDNGQSAGTSIDDINYLLFLQEKYPDDLKKIFREYPIAERKLYEYKYKLENERTKTK